MRLQHAAPLAASLHSPDWDEYTLSMTVISAPIMTHAIKQKPSVLEAGATLPCASAVLDLAEAQMARQNAILLTKSARLYTKLRTLSWTLPIKYPKKYPC